MTIAVFLGPTLPVADARAILGDALYLPPVAAGDVHDVMQRGPTAIAIIDGFFDQIPSVWHKEILYALSQGVPVLGASSMGALRGAELHAFGMIGVGAIFEAYRDGVLEDDDEVAVIHGPADGGYVGLSEAMVNLRDGLARACDAGAIAPATRDRLIAAGKARFYAERTWDAVYADAGRLGVAADEVTALRAFVRRERPNLKRDDAVRLLRRLAEHGAPPRHVAGFEFHPTCHWIEHTLREQRVEPGRDVTVEAVVQQLAVSSGNASPILREALFVQLLAAESERLDLEVERTDLERARQRFAADPALSDDDRDQLATAEAIADELIARRLSELGPYVRLVLARRGELEQAATRVERDPAVDDTADVAALLAWYRATSGIVEATPEAYARRLGLPSARAFLDHLVARYGEGSS